MMNETLEYPKPFDRMICMQIALVVSFLLYALVFVAFGMRTVALVFCVLAAVYFVVFEVVKFVAKKHVAA